MMKDDTLGGVLVKLNTRWDAKDDQSGGHFKVQRYQGSPSALCLLPQV